MRDALARTAFSLAALFLTFTTSMPAPGAAGGGAAEGAKLERLSGEFQFTEGATCDAAGKGFYSIRLQTKGANPSK